MSRIKRGIGKFKKIKREKKPKTWQGILLSFFVLIILSNVLILLFKTASTTGQASITSGLVTFEIISPPLINITSPLNITYDYTSLTDVIGPFLIDLNVTANFDATNWRYYLYDYRHGGVPVEENIGFAPNTTIDVVRWDNRLFVEATAYEGTADEQQVSAEVFFYIHYNNTPPILDNIFTLIYLCENQDLFYKFNATDYDEDDLFFSIFPPNPFFIASDYGGRVNNFVITNAFYSGILRKLYFGTIDTAFRNFPENITVNDGEYSDLKEIDLTLIQINNPPNISDIGSQTVEVWQEGANTTFYHNTLVKDIEYNSPWNYGVLNFNLVIINSSGNNVNLFTINASGTMNFTATNTTPLDAYNVSVCVNDTGIPNKHPEILLLCNQTGESMTTCNNFSFVVTNRNRAPTIIDHYPENLSANISGSDSLYFNITKYDPDGGIPDAYWYVDNVFKEYDSGSLVDEFSFTFGCGISDKHLVKVDITDGLLNDSLNWTFNIENVVCILPAGGGGGGGGGGATCIPQWGCIDWGVCQHAATSLETGILSGKDYRLIQENCTKYDLDESLCGFQINSCVDLKGCNSTFGKPEEIKWCHYTANPSCKDNIKNCHDGGCEVLVDCGGPCSACPTCSDGKKNQGEEGIDCGGPCPWKCIPEIPLLKRPWILYTFTGFILILIILLIIVLIRVLKHRKELTQFSS